LILLSFAAILRSAASDPEDELKSATVLTFIRHAEWRESATGPINVAVWGRSATVQTLRRTLEGRAANSRPIHIVDAKLPAGVNDCQVVYIAGDDKEVRQTLAGWRNSHALTIGESGRFLEYGGAVNLVIVDGHMSFEVSREALERAGVSISSTLLRYGQVTPTAAPAKARPPA
jgi:hypothetical protein